MSYFNQLLKECYQRLALRLCAAVHRLVVLQELLCGIISDAQVLCCAVPFDCLTASGLR
jgi:hypothetical protein